MPHIFVAEARFYDDIAEALSFGARQALEAAKCTYETAAVPGALELPSLIRFAIESGRFDGYVALGCVIRGETTHYETVCNESARGLTNLALKFAAPIGNGILTVENGEQAMERARADRKNKGAGAVEACLSLISAKEHLLGKQHA